MLLYFQFHWRSSPGRDVRPSRHLDYEYAPARIAAYLITYLIRRHARVKLLPNFLGPERISSSTELALRFYFLVRVENLVDLGAW